MTQTNTGWDKVILDEPDFRTVKETAQHLRLCEKQIRRLIGRRELPAYRFGGAIRINKKDLDEYMRRSAISK
jgi:excisionase family DNA binding protein